MNAGNLILLIIGIMFSAGCVSPGVRPEEHSNMRKFFQKLKCGEEATVAYFGGSITWGATATDPLKTSWRALLAKRLQREFPAARLVPVDAAIGGKGSDLGVFRMDRDVLPFRPDLTFVEFAVNDAQNPERLECMEGILRKLHTGRPDMAIVLVITGYGTESFESPREEDYRSLAAYYGIPAISVVPEVRRRIAAGEFSCRDILTDGTHPNDRGYALYCDIIFEQLMNCGDSGPWPEKPLTANRFESARMIELASLLPPAASAAAWRRELPSVTGVWFDHQPSRWLPSVIVPERETASLSLETACSGAGVYYETVPGGDRFELLADGVSIFAADTKFPWPYPGLGNRFQLLPVAGKHTITVKAHGPNLRLGCLLLTGP